LQEGGLLAMFVTSVKGSLSTMRALPAPIRRRLRMRAADGVPPHKVLSLPFVELLLLALRPFGEESSQVALDVFDRRVSRLVSQAQPQVVVGCEDSCRRTFREGNASGCLCVLDAASVHHSSHPRTA